MMKNHAGPNNKGLPLKRISRTLFRKKDYTTKPWASFCSQYFFMHVRIFMTCQPEYLSRALSLQQLCPKSVIIESYFTFKQQCLPHVIIILGLISYINRLNLCPFKDFFSNTVPLCSDILPLKSSLSVF